MIMEIMCIIFIWIIFGLLSAFILIGSLTDKVPVSVFGIFNGYNNKNIRYKNSETIEKYNIRLYVYFTLGGIISFIFMLCYFIIKGLQKLIRTIIYGFN